MIELYEKLLEKKPDNPGYQAELAVALSQLGNCLIQQGPEKSDTAKQSLEKALVIQENILAQQSEDKNIKEAIALTRERLEKLENLERDQPENLEKLENPEILEKQEKPEIPEEQEKSKTLEEQEKPEILEEQKKSENLEKLENPENSENSEKL